MVRDTLIDKRAMPGMRTDVVWVPMLDGDERPEAVKQAADIFGGSPAVQFWDGDKRFGAEITRSLGVADWHAWDIFLFYKPGSEWTSQGMPAPDAAIIESNGMLLATKGVLSPTADQSGLPERFRDRAEVVANVAELPSVLGQVAAVLTKRAAP